MKIKSAKSFRQWYKNLIPARKHAAQYWDENFMGVQHKDVSGFLAMYHGDKEDIYGFLRKEVEMAEDGQAIYEFVQNAADSDSTKFYMFYDENHLIVINNGNVFSKEGVKSILNIGQSFGKEDPDKIGRYGIGFKLVHRLVGKSSGLDELFNIDEQGYRGPILFSWSEKLQFNNFLNTNENDFDYVDFNNNDAPWLLKILITNFPAQPKETIKDTNFNVIEPFQVEELNSFQTFLKSCRDKIDSDSLDSGTIFFLKLGDKKFDYLERQKQEYLNGLSTSMHFLKSLDTLVINEDVIRKDKEANNVLEFTVKNGSDEFNKIGLTEIRDKESDAQFKICFADNPNSANEIKKHPNIYKYFPAVKEVNNLSFVIHSNLFELSSNRQNLTETPINKNLLGLLSKRVIEKMEVSKTENRSTFKNLFISILMSEESSSSSSGNGWQSEYFYNVLLEYIQKTIPTKSDAFSNNARSVKINKLKLNLDLADLGLSHIQWFEWDSEEDKLLIGEAKNKEKLGIEEWDIRHIIENANLEKINDWIASCEKETYERFLKELEGSGLRNATEEKIRKIKLFKFSNDRFFSLDEVIKKDNFGRPVFKFTNCFFSNHKTKGIKNVLIKLGLVVSELFVEDYPKMFSSIAFPDDRKHYDLIAEWCIENGNKLSGEEKKKLFLNFINEETKFESIADETLKTIHLFCNSNSQGNIKPLSELIGRSYKTYSWLSAYMIEAEEYFPELKSYLIQEEEIFDKIILPNIEIIKDELTETKEIKELITIYKENHRSFFNEYIIQKDTNGFAIIDKSDKYQIIPSKNERKVFINFIETYLSDSLVVLPYNFSDFNDQDGILKGEKLHSQILGLIDIDEHKEVLVDIIHYNDPKRKLIREISEFRFNSEVEYTKEDYEYKILELACNELKEIDFQIFRNKVIIKTGARNFNLSEIPPIADKIKIDTEEFSLSKILPSTYQNNNLISDLILQFEGIPREKLNALFGVSEEPELSVIFQMFSEQVETLENPEQFFFLLYYHQDNPKVDLSKLGFDIECAVYPSEFALENEKLPEYLQQWINNEEIKLPELEKLGIWTENTVLVELRKFLKGEINEFSNVRLAQDTRFNEDETMLFNTFEWLKEKSIKLSAPEQFESLKKIVDIINESRKSKGDLIIQEEYNFELLMENSTIWQETENFSIHLYNGEMPKTVGLDEIKDYIFYNYNNDDFAVNENSIYVNENTDIEKTLQKVASDDNNDFSFKELWKLFKGDDDNTNEDNQETNTTFLDEVNQFIAEELEDTEWSDYIPDLKNLLQDFNNHPQEKQKLFNLIAKIKLAKERNIKYEDLDEGFNVVKIGDEKYFVHSARGAFAYIHPNEILKMINEGYKMALDFNTKSRIKIYDKAEDILELNTNHILAFQGDKPFEDLIAFCEANRGEKKHLLIIDKDNANEKSKAYLKLFNNSEDDYQ